MDRIKRLCLGLAVAVAVLSVPALAHAQDPVTLPTFEFDLAEYAAPMATKLLAIISGGLGLYVLWVAFRAGFRMVHKMIQGRPA